MATKKAAKNTGTALKKITLSEVCGKLAKNSVKEAYDMMVVFGITAMSKVGTSANGTYVKWIGIFEAVNLQTGEVFQSNSLILPADGEEILSVMTMENKQAKFSFNIKVAPSAKSPTGYVFITQASGQADSMAMLAEMRNSEDVVALLPAK
jgi:sugar lactone lactonase YvrE